MAKPILIIVTGPSASGKTTVAKKIAAETGFPLITKDSIKEILFDTIGWKEDFSWSKTLTKASFYTLRYLIEVFTSAGRSLIVEANFRPLETNPQLQPLQKKYKFRVVQIFCTAKDSILIKRYLGREGRPDRHPGHVEHVNIDGFKKELAEKRYYPLDLKGSVITVDTTDAASIDYAELIRRVKGSISK